MRTMLFVILGSLLAAGALSPAHAAEDDAPAWNESASEHFRFLWREGEVPEDVLAAAPRRAERFYAAIAGMLGYEPGHTVFVLFDGPAERPDGDWAYPRVDSFQRIHLVSYDPSGWSYLSPLAHELAHVFRNSRATPPRDWFLEEGMAEFVARRVEPDKKGFPTYEYPLTVVAGQWLARGQGIPMTELRARHDELNLPCKLQAYSLRASFFLYLGDTFGDAELLRFGEEHRDGTGYGTAFGAPLPDLAERWEADLRARYAAFEDADRLAREYREQSPARYQPVCDETRIAGSD